VINRKRTEDELAETIEMAGKSMASVAEMPCVKLLKMYIWIAGTTGNIYTIKIALVPTCSCPDSSKGNQCKHIVYVSLCALVSLPTLSQGDWALSVDSFWISLIDIVAR
jgi:hypothetical protein